MTVKNDDKSDPRLREDEKSSEMQKIAKSYQSGWAYAEYAFQYAIAIVICSLIGYWLDKFFNTGNVLLIIGVFLGAAAGFIGLLKSLKVIDLKKKNDKKGNDSGK